MAKMLMGQIDHARDRIKALTREKLGECPGYPSVPSEGNFKEGVENGTIKVSSLLVNDALDAWLGQDPRITIQQSSSRYNSSSCEYETVPATLVTKNSGDLGEYLSYTYFQEKYEAAVAIYKSEIIEYNRRATLIKAEAHAVEDAIVLGDNAAALAALQAFAAFTV